MLPLFPTQYQGGTQDEGTKFTIDGYEIDSDDTPIESIHNIGKQQRAYNAIGIENILFLWKMMILIMPY